jgi:uncharacterized protein
MIKPAEIQKIAGKLKVRDTQIEKDYILSWILIGISNNQILSKNLVFKGGTVLKKFYFENYRFSEDLDFTLIDDSVSESAIQAEFKKVFAFIKERANITLSIVDFSTHTTGNINFYISYSGPLGGNGANKQVKVDISKTEILRFSVASKAMFCSYSDQEGCMFQCYSLNEVMVEKMRSLISRTQPRDYYDLWYLCENEGMEMVDYKNEFELKARDKNINPNDLKQKIAAKRDVFKSRWAKSMKDQISDLPPFDQVNRELGRHFRLLFK